MNANELLVWKEIQVFQCQALITLPICEWKSRVNEALVAFPPFTWMVTHGNKLVSSTTNNILFFDNAPSFQVSHNNPLIQIKIYQLTSSITIAFSMLFDYPAVMAFLTHIITGRGVGTRIITPNFIHEQQKNSIWKVFRFACCKKKHESSRSRQLITSGSGTFTSLLAMMILYSSINEKLSFAGPNITVHIGVDTRDGDRNREYIGNATTYERIDIPIDEIAFGTCKQLGSFLARQYAYHQRAVIFNKTRRSYKYAAVEHKTDLKRSIMVEFIDATNTHCTNFFDLTQRLPNTITIIKYGQYYEITIY
jgi:hypothetical protein